MYNYYITLLGYPNIPEFLNKYLTLSSLNRLKHIGYFCGMDYASSNIYNFKEYISRYMHSLSTSLLVYYLTKDKRCTLQALFHDISTPVFSHVIDYMNKDYIYQETTEEFTELILKSDKKLLEYLELDKIPLDNLVNFKFSTIVDSPRPKMCADRLDGIILNGSYWTKTLNEKDIFNIIKSTELYINEESIPEIGFNITKLVISFGIPKFLNTHTAISAIKSINPEALNKLTDKKRANNVGNKFKTVCNPSMTPSEKESKTTGGCGHNRPRSVNIRRCTAGLP